MTGEILHDVVQTLDTYRLFDQSNNKKSVFLLDGHNSRLSAPFVNYVLDIAHKWSIIFGVPYGTSLGQVGDSKQRNGSYKISLSKYKDIIVRKKLTECWEKPNFEDTDIIPAINLSWDESFRRVQTNQEAIAEKGWFPFNMNLLLNDQIRATMNEDDKKWERENLEISPYSLNLMFKEQLLNLPEDEDPYLQPKYSTTKSKLNYSYGEAARCIEQIVSQEDLQSARDRIQKNRDVGKMRQELVNGVKRLSAGNLFLADICSVGIEVTKRIKNNTQKVLQQEKADFEKA